MKEHATFAAGCFWGVEEVFRKLPGVLETEVGYTGGRTEKPTYKDVCSDTTGHAEATHITFDPKIIPYEKLVREFFELHDPTTMNRQGPDVGSQYRSAIFYHSQEQKEIAEKIRAELEQSDKFGLKPIVTEINPAQKFWRAEEYHQKYFQKNPDDPRLCHVR